MDYRCRISCRRRICLPLKKIIRFKMNVEEKVKELVIKQLKIDPSVYHHDLAAGDIPEWDSLGHVNLLMATESYFEVSFDISDAIDVETIADLIDTTNKYVAQKG